MFYHIKNEVITVNPNANPNRNPNFNLNPNPNPNPNANPNANANANPNPKLPFTATLVTIYLQAAPSPNRNPDQLNLFQLNILYHIKLVQFIYKLPLTLTVTLTLTLTPTPTLTLIWCPGAFQCPPSPPLCSRNCVWLGPYALSHRLHISVRAYSYSKHSFQTST